MKCAQGIQAVPLCALFAGRDASAVKLAGEEQTHTGKQGPDGNLPQLELQLSKPNITVIASHSGPDDGVGAYRACAPGAARLVVGLLGCFRCKRPHARTCVSTPCTSRHAPTSARTAQLGWQCIRCCCWPGMRASRSWRPCYTHPHPQQQPAHAPVALPNPCHAMMRGWTDECMEPHSPPPPHAHAHAELDAPWEHSADWAYGMSTSMYDCGPSGRRNGDPVADCFGVLGYPEGAVIAVADGVNWGEPPRRCVWDRVYPCTPVHATQCNAVQWPRPGLWLCSCHGGCIREGPAMLGTPCTASEGKRAHDSHAYGGLPCVTGSL